MNSISFEEGLDAVSALQKPLSFRKLVALSHQIRKSNTNWRSTFSRYHGIRFLIISIRNYEKIIK